MSGKRKLGKGLRFGVLMVVAGLIILLLPLNSINAEPVPAGWHRIESGTGWGDKDTTITVSEGCDITKIMIKAGNQAGVDGKSGEITVDGSYGHYALLDGNVPASPIVLHPNQSNHYVTAGPDIVDNKGTPGDTSDDLTYRWFGAYVVTNLSGVHNTVRIQVITTYGNIIHDLSHIDYYYECGQVVLGKIKLTKSGLETGATAYFKLTDGTNYYHTDGSVVSEPPPYGGEPVTSASNVVTWSNLPWGTYTFEETIPAGYTFGGYTPSDTVTIDANNAGTTVEVNASNTQKPGIIKLTKSGLETGATAYFKLTDGTNYYHTDGSVVSEPPPYDGEPVTSSSNVVTWSNLPWGTYTFDETIPAGYAFGGYTPGDTVTIDANNAGQTVTVSASNEKVKAYIIICKEVDEIITATEFHFKIYDSNIADIPITVDVADNKCSDPIGLPLGTYIVEETDIGYTVTIKVGGVEKKKGISPQSVEVILDEGDIGDTITVLFENDPGLGKIKLTKNGLKAGATAYFKLKSGTDYYNTSGIIDNSAAYQGEPVTSSSNEVLWSDMPWGTYTFKEDIPAGYTFVGYTPGKTVTIDETNQAAIVAVIATNTKTKDGNGKKDGDGDGIEVLGIQELPFTGFNWIYYVVGMALIIAGGFTSISVTRFLKRKEQ